MSERIVDDNTRVIRAFYRGGNSLSDDERCKRSIVTATINTSQSCASLTVVGSFVATITFAKTSPLPCNARVYGRDERGYRALCQEFVVRALARDRTGSARTA